jgi:polyhydroxybutyrate depolymerase
MRQVSRTVFVASSNRTVLLSQPGGRGSTVDSDRKRGVFAQAASTGVIRTLSVRLVVCLVAAAGTAGIVGCDGPTGGPHSSGSAPAETPAPGDHSLTLAFGANTYKYLLHAPPGYTRGKRLPLVIALHFYPGTGEEVRETIGMDGRADQANFLVAYPDGIDGGFNALVCCGTTDDVGFLRTLAAHIVQVWSADPDRVYLTGISNGGDMSLRAAVEASGVFAAIGVVSAGFGGPRVEPADYAPKSPVSLITFIGAADQYFDIFRNGLDTWRQRLKCARTTSGPLPAGARGTYERARCADGSDVDAYVIELMGHVWPGAKSGRLAGSDIPVPATELIWAFFEAHPRLPR